jgi:hypothetical protein
VRETIHTEFLWSNLLEIFQLEVREGVGRTKLRYHLKTAKMFSISVIAQTLHSVRMTDIKMDLREIDHGDRTSSGIEAMGVKLARKWAMRMEIVQEDSPCGWN